VKRNSWILCGAVLSILVLGQDARAQTCQPGPWQECLALEQECVQCGSPCYEADSGPCWEAQACSQGYYVYDQWQEHKGVNCQFTGAFRCHYFQTYTEYFVDEVRHETWQRRECYDGSSGIFTTMTHSSSTFPISAWRKGGYCSYHEDKPSPVIHDCI